MATRKPYPGDVSDEEWVFVAPYLALLRQDAPQRDHDERAAREVLNGLRWVLRTGSPWLYMPHDLPTVGGCLPANAAMAFSCSVRADDPRFARTPLAPFGGQGARAYGGHIGLWHAEIYP
jgi:transposase